MSDTGKEEEALKQLQAQQGWLLDKIDELRTIGVGGLVELPQIIVCGNQSSGKSSVLEAISRVRFPMKSNLCTRFATEVSLRRQPITRFKVIIEPGSSRKSDSDREKLKEFSPAAFTNSDRLPELIEQAKECMGITGEVGFSDDILKIEISGPDKPELTLVDLPGLYYSTSASQGQEGIQIVRSLTERYMKNARSIILAVFSAKADLHVQEVLNIAEKFDSTRERTIGIVTQPDTLEAHSEEEESWLKNVQNQNVRLQLGWHALRNRSFETRNASDDERDSQERDFFRKGKWISIPRDCVGIDSLRRRLSGVLLKHIRNNLPGLISDINDKIQDRQSRLNKLGASRSTLQQQRGFLLGLSSGFERITGQALDGMYTDDFFGGLENCDLSSTQDTRRLRAVIRDLNEHFAENMETRGCHRYILGVNGSGYNIFETGNSYKGLRQPKYIRRPEIEKEINDLARRNRGIELPGNANQLLVGTLFRDQSKPWEELARHHLIKAWESVGFFISLVMQHLTDEYTYQAVVGTVIGPQLDKMQTQLLEKLEELTAYQKRGHPLPLSYSFLTRIQKARSDRYAFKLFQTLQPENSKKEEKFTLESIKQATEKLESSSNQFAAAEIIDQMQAYYDTAIATFIDNIATLAIENCLLGPLNGIFTSQTINNMDDQQVHELASEPSFIMEERDLLARDLEKLQAGLRALNQFNVPKAIVKTAGVPLKTQQDPQTSAENTISNGQATLSSRAPGPPASTSTATKSTLTPDAPSSSATNKAQLSASASTNGPFAASFSGTPQSTTPNSSSSGSLFSKSSTPAATSGGLFGGLQRPSSSLFPPGGAFSNPPKPTGLFGGAPSPSFSSSNGPSGSAFGSTGGFSSTGGFGQSKQSPAPEPAFGGSSSQSSHNAFEGSNHTYNFSAPTSKDSSMWRRGNGFYVEKEGNYSISNHYMHISCGTYYDKFSPEEIRLSDYQWLGKIK